MSTLNLTSADFGDKFKAIQSQITPTVLNGYINRSERLNKLDPEVKRRIKSV